MIGRFLVLGVLLLFCFVKVDGFGYNDGGVDEEDGKRLSEKGDYVIRPNIKTFLGEGHVEYTSIKNKTDANLLLKFKNRQVNLQKGTGRTEKEKEKEKEVERALNRRSVTGSKSNTQSPVPPESESISATVLTSVSPTIGGYQYHYYGEVDDIITEPARIIPIFYGCNSSVDQWFGYHTYNIDKFLNDLGSNSMWWWMVQQYSNPVIEYYAIQTTPSTSVGYVSQFVVQDTVLMCDYPFGTDVTTEEIQTKIVRHAMYRYNAGTGSRSDIYVIIPDASVRFEGACTEFCGFHYAYGDKKRVFNVVMIANPFYCLYEFDDFHMCASTLLRHNGNGAPNGNVETDAQVNIIAHEIAEVVTDPYGYGWSSYTPIYGQEIADPCAWQFKDVYYDDNVFFNELMGSGRYLIQSVMPGSCPNVEICTFGCEYYSICSSSTDWLSFGEEEYGCFCANFELFC